MGVSWAQATFFLAGLWIYTRATCLGLEAEEASLNPQFQKEAQETSSPGRDPHLGVSWVRWHFGGASWNLSCQRGLESEVPFTCSSPLR